MSFLVNGVKSIASGVVGSVAKGVITTANGLSATGQEIYHNTVEHLVGQGKEKHSGEKQNGTDKVEKKIVTDKVETIHLDNVEKNLIKKDLQCVFSYYVERNFRENTKNVTTFDSIRRIPENIGQYSATPYANNDTVITKKFWTSIYGDICSTINSFYKKEKPCINGITFEHYKELSTVIEHWINVPNFGNSDGFDNADGHLFQYIFMYYHGDEKLSDDSVITKEQWDGIFDGIPHVGNKHTFKDFVLFFIGIAEGVYRDNDGYPVVFGKSLIDNSLTPLKFHKPLTSGGMKKRSRKSKRRNKKNGKTKKR
jgi:hypothetical protein